MLDKTDGNIYRYTGTDYNPAKHEWTDKDIRTLSNIYWSDLDCAYGSDDPGLLCIPSVLSGGDYCNSCAVEYANYLEWQELFADTLSVDWWTVSGSYGSYGVAIRNDTDNAEILEMLASLSDYPVINDDRVSEVEMEWQDYSYRDFIARDFINEIDKQFDIELLICFPEDDTRVSELFYALAERANEYWEIEQHGTAWICVEKLVDAMTYSDLIPFVESIPD